MYHVGIVKQVIKSDSKNTVKSADQSTQAVLKMWDENLLIILVDKKLAKKIKEKDYVIADYTPVSPESPHRKMIVIKILSDAAGKKMWAEFQGELNRKKSKTQEVKQYYPYIR